MNGVLNLMIKGILPFINVLSAMAKQEPEAISKAFFYVICFIEVQEVLLNLNRQQ